MKNEIDSQKIVKTCDNCGKSYETTVFYSNHGEQFLKICNNCKTLKDNSERLENYKRIISEESPKIKKQWFKDYGIEGIYLDKTFENFEWQKQSKVYQLLKNYKGQSIVLIHPNNYGIGKTHLISALANQLVNFTEPIGLDEKNIKLIYNQCPVFCISESKLIDKIREIQRKSDNSEGTEFEFYNRFINLFPLLIIDDVGKIQPWDLRFIQGVYYRIIDGRYTNNKPIILVTNLEYNSLENHIGGACADRLKEMCGDNVIKMAGMSCR